MSRIPIRLSLKKPKNWNVSLTTSSSSASIAIPAIELQDESGRILIDTSPDKIREETSKKGHLKRNGQCLKNDEGVGRERKDLGMKSRIYLNRSEGSCSSISKHRKPGDGKIQKMKKSDHVNLDKENPDNRITQRGRKFKENATSKFPSGSNKLKSCCDVVSKCSNSRIPRLSNQIDKDRKLFYSSTDEEVKENIKLRKGDYLVGVPLGSYEEANALLAGASDIFRLKVSGHRKAKHDPVAGGARRSKRRLVNSKDSGMGSNVSRHSGKGLSGRRTQSSGNLCNGAKILAPSVGRILNPCGAGGVSPRDRNKFCGSLPNHLDDKDVRSGDCTPESIYNGNNNYGEVYTRQAPVPAKNVELLFHKLIPHQDLGGGDQGYGSERSPEDEQPPSLPTEPQPRRNHYSTIRRNKEFPFITKENTFDARLEKGSRGLGLSVTGGVDTAEPYPGLIRIKRIFPHQPAWECGILQLGDVILAANGVPLSGLTNYEALEVLRTTPNDVVLKICRPPGDIFLIPPLSSGEPPPPPRRDPSHVISSSQSNNASNILPLPQLIPEPFGEFDVTLKKVNGSLGFTLRKEDESVLGHYVRALVREPALSDGRIRPGDKIVSVNGVDISPMSHEEAVMFLRQSGEEVCLRLYRDPAQTPVSALSPTESHKTFKPKPALRKEAMDMLCDLAVRKLSPSDSSSSSGRSRLKSSSPGSSPRRRKLTKTPPESEDSKPQRPNFLDLCGDGTLRRHKFQMVNVNPEEDADSVLTGTSGSENTQTTVGSATRACISSDECNSDNDGSYHGEPSSMPPLTTSSSVFSYKNPIYQSAHPAVHTGPEQVPERLSDQDIPDSVFNKGGGTQGLLKWKGVLFTPEDGVDDEDYYAKEKTDFNHSSNFRDGKGQVLTVELCRGWNSRLGFSLQGSESGTYISAIYADSVAAKDGRLQAGDQVIMINDESTEDMNTADVIDLLRKVRGTIAITVLRKNPTQS